MNKELKEIIQKYPLSNFETEVLGLICKHETITITDLANTIYKHKRKRPKSLNNGVVSAVRQINKKIEPYQLTGNNHGCRGKFLTLIKV